MQRKYRTALVFLWIGFFLFFTDSSKAQEKNSNSSFELGADVVSRYYWRGVSLNSSPAIQPYLEFSYGGVTLGAWGSYSFSTEPYQEVDLYISYELNNIKLLITDCFTLVDSIDISHGYLDWNNRSTSHAVEASLEVSNLFKSPISLKGGVYFHGDDKDEYGENYFSTYLEAQCNFSVREQSLTAFAGFTPFEGMYGDQAAFVNVGVCMERDLAIGQEFVLPLGVLFAINPHTESVFMVAKISF